MSETKPVNLYLWVGQHENIVFVKIGVAKDPRKRAAHIQTSCPLRLSEMRYIPIGNRPTTRLAEEYIHNRLADYRANGEWFAFNLGDRDQAEFFKAMVRAGVRIHKTADGSWTRLVPKYTKCGMTHLVEAPMPVKEAA